MSLTPTVSGAFLSRWMTSVAALARSESDCSVRESAVCNRAQRDVSSGAVATGGAHSGESVCPLGCL